MAFRLDGALKLCCLGVWMLVQSVFRERVYCAYLVMHACSPSHVPPFGTLIS